MHASALGRVLGGSQAKETDMKRLIGMAAIAAAATFGLVGHAAASNEHAPHHNPGAHPHHRHTPDGACHDMEGPDFAGEHGGRHWGAVKSSQVHHGSCEGAHPAT